MGLKHLHAMHPRLLLAGLFMIGAFAVASAPAAAQDEGSGSFDVLVVLCLEPGCTEIEDLTEPVDGVGVEVLDSDTQQSIGTCTTGDSAPGACAVELPDGTTSVTILLDESSLPDGYVSTDNPATVAVADTNQYPFLLMPEGGFPPEDGDDDADAPDDSSDDAADDTDGTEDDAVSGLPRTGSGSGGADTGVVVTSMVALTAILGLAGMMARKLVNRV